MAQWRAAGPALEEFRAAELGRLDQAQNAEIASAFFIMKNGESESLATSGLVEQQTIFLRARP